MAKIEEKSSVMWIGSSRYVEFLFFQLNKYEVENGLCIHRNQAGWPSALKPPTGYQHKENCPVPEVAPGPNWVPYWVLNGDTKPGPCAWELT